MLDDGIHDSVGDSETLSWMNSKLNQVTPLTPTIFVTSDLSEILCVEYCYT